MARSAKDRLSAIRAKTEKARRMQEKAEEEFELLIQPLKKKLVTVADAAADTFVREHIEEMDSLNLTKTEQNELQERMLEAFAETLRNAGREEGGTTQQTPSERADGATAPTNAGQDTETKTERDLDSEMADDL